LFANFFLLLSTKKKLLQKFIVSLPFSICHLFSFIIIIKKTIQWKTMFFVFTRIAHTNSWYKNYFVVEKPNWIASLIFMKKSEFIVVFFKKKCKNTCINFLLLFFKKKHVLWIFCYIWYYFQKKLNLFLKQTKVNIMLSVFNLILHIMFFKKCEFLLYKE